MKPNIEVIHVTKQHFTQTLGNIPCNHTSLEVYSLQEYPIKHYIELQGHKEPYGKQVAEKNKEPDIHRPHNAYKSSISTDDLNIFIAAGNISADSKEHVSDNKLFTSMM